MKTLIMYDYLGIQRRLDTMNWDEPEKVLLSLAAALESDMGGSSGAVSQTFPQLAPVLAVMHYNSAV